MSGEADLVLLLAETRPRLDPEIYAFATLPPDAPAPAAALMRFNEDEGVTYILPRAEAERLNIAYAYPCRRITMQVYSALEAVGFLAALAARLAQAGISVNTVSAFHHDHLFVPVERAEEAFKLVAAQ